MKIHHLNCGTACPLASRILTQLPSTITCHCFLIELGDKLVLVDSGLGMKDVMAPHRRLGPLVSILRFKLSAEETALRQVQQLGFDPRDVTDLVLTHLDFDHAGGMLDFPHARVHVAASELAHATRRKAFDKFRYRPKQWLHGVRWETYGDGGERWLDFAGVQGFRGLPPEILSVPLPGHTVGHRGVALRRSDDWILHAGDAYYGRHEIRLEDHGRFERLALAAFRSTLDVNLKAAASTRRQLSALRDRPELTLVCAHDPEEMALARRHRDSRNGDRGH